MYRNLSPKAMGITGRQSEIIELALTYGFRGMELDIHDFVKRVEHRGLDHASRFLRSSQLKIGGFELPVSWRGDESVYRADLEKLGNAATCAASIGAKQCHTLVWPGSENLPYHENFELHRRRLGEIAEALDKHGIRLGVGLAATAAQRQAYQFQFIREAESLVTLIKSVGNDNVGFMLDTWLWHFGGGTHDLLRGVAAKGVVAVFLADAPVDVNLQELSEEQRVLPGEGGLIDTAAVLSLLYESGYRGPVTLAPHPRSFSGMTRDAIVQHCGNILEDLWRAIGLGRTGKMAPATAENA